MSLSCRNRRRYSRERASERLKTGTVAKTAIVAGCGADPAAIPHFKAFAFLKWARSVAEEHRCGAASHDHREVRFKRGVARDRPESPFLNLCHLSWWVSVGRAASQLFLDYNKVCRQHADWLVVARHSSDVCSTLPSIEQKDKNSFYRFSPVSLHSWCSRFAASTPAISWWRQLVVFLFLTRVCLSFIFKYNSFVQLYHWA